MHLSVGAWRTIRAWGVLDGDFDNSLLRYRPTRRGCCRCAPLPRIGNVQPRWREVVELPTFWFVGRLRQQILSYAFRPMFRGLRMVAVATIAV